MRPFKSTLDELKTLPVDYQRRVIWTFRIAGGWLATILFGAGVFLLSKPYMDRERERKLKAGILVKEIREGEDYMKSLNIKRDFSSHQVGSARGHSVIKSQDKFEQVFQVIEPPKYMAQVIDDIVEEEKKMETNE